MKSIAKRKLVCIIGAGHCGSTLLDLIIGSHSSAFSLGELHAIARHMDRGNGDSPRICSVCEGVCEFWNQRASLPLIKLYYARKSRIRSFMGMVARNFYNPYKLLFGWSGKSVLVDSSKQPYWFSKQLTPAYTLKDIDVYLIYIARDGRAVVNSYLRKYPERNVGEITGNWINQVLARNSYFDQFEKTKRLLVRYEELANEPEGTVQSICEFLDLSYEKDMLRYWVHDHHLIAGNAGTNSLIWEYRKKFKMDVPESEKLHDVKGYKQYYDSEYYEQIGLAIRFDQRWRNELTSEQIDVFDAMAADINKPYAFND